MGARHLLHLQSRYVTGHAKLHLELPCTSGSHFAMKHLAGVCVPFNHESSVAWSGLCSNQPEKEACCCCRKQKRRADGNAEPERVPLHRKVLLWLGIALLLTFVIVLLIISLIASFHPQAVHS